MRQLRSQNDLSSTRNQYKNPSVKVKHAQKIPVIDHSIQWEYIHLAKLGNIWMLKKSKVIMFRKKTLFKNLLSISLIFISHGMQAVLKFSKSRWNFIHF